MTCLNLESLFWGATEGGARREVGPFLSFFYTGKIGCVCEREREKYPALTFSIQHPHLVNHVKKTTEN